jgi:hypothetical protein
MTKFSLLFLVLFFSLLSFSQTNESSLLVYGEGFSFTIKEPKGWIGDIENAKEYGANIIFYKDKTDLKNGGAIVQVLGFTKQDEQTNKDLEADVESYKKEYPKAKLQDFEAKHKDYKTFSKLVYVDKKFYQYIVYINGGKKYINGFSVAMNISNRQATQEELQSYLNIISSLTILAK